MSNHNRLRTAPLLPLLSRVGALHPPSLTYANYGGCKKHPPLLLTPRSYELPVKRQHLATLFS